MTELILKVGDSKEFTDGDIVHAMSPERILLTHAWHICHPKHAPRIGGQFRLIDGGSLARTFYELTHQYRFEWSGGRTRRVEIASEEVELTDASPKGHMFDGGAAGVVWYGGRKDFYGAAAAVWDAIEGETSSRRNDSFHTLYPWGTLDIRHYLVVRAEALTEAECHELTRRQWAVDGNGEPVFERLAERSDEVVEQRSGQRVDGAELPPDERKTWRRKKLAERGRFVQWRDLLGDLRESEANVTDRQRPVGTDRWEIHRGGLVGNSKDQAPQLKTIVQDRGL